MYTQLKRFQKCKLCDSKRQTDLKKLIFNTHRMDSTFYDESDWAMETDRV